jgi:hypothetical protein
MANNLTTGQSLGLLAVGIGCIWFMASHSDDKPAAPANAPGAEVAQTAGPESAPTEAATMSNVDIARKMNLTQAIETTRRAMTDTVDDTSPGTAALAFWATAAPMKWDELVGLTRTRAPLVFKDPDEQRGKLLCASGEVVEITAEHSEARKIYLGGLADTSGTVYRFAAVGSTGDLVQGSTAAFCGVVTGRVDYSNSGGGTTHAIQLVGMFKLPANMKAAKS